MPTSPSPRRGARPGAAKAAPAGSRVLWPLVLLVFLLAAAGVMVSVLPASLSTRFLPPAVHAEDFSGSLWHGSAGRISVAGRDAGAIEWHLHPGALLHLALDAQLHWVKGGFVLDGTVDADRTHLAASAVQGGGPIEDLRDLGVAAGWRGIATVRIERLEALLSGEAPRLQAAVGEISVANVTAQPIAAGTDLGGYVLRFKDASIGPEATAVLADTGGPLALDATIQFTVAERRGILSGTLRERDGASPALKRLMDDLGQMHARDAEGRLPIDVEFTL